MKHLMCALQYLRLLPSGSKWGLVYVILTLGMVNNAGASWLDSDYWCRVYGCIAVGDGNAWDIYDVYDFSTGRTVRAGQPLIAWSGNPYQGSGTVNAVKTGTLNPVDTPNTYQGVLIDIDQNGDSLADGLLSDANASGYLDLGDGLAEFGLTPQTDIVLKDRAFKHSFYIAARTDFYVYGRAWLQSGSGELADSIRPEQTGLGVDMVRTGVDNGFAFGSSTTDPDFVPASGIADLDDIWNTPKRLAEFRRNGGTRASNSNDVANQAVRVDIEYQLPEPDFSYGTGELAYRVEYLFYNR